MSIGTRVRFGPHIRFPALPEPVRHIPSSGHIAPIEAVTTIQDRAAFEAFAARDDVPGLLAVREVKFLMSGYDQGTPTLHFMNSTRNPLHFDFARDHLGFAHDVATFNRVTYFAQDRQFLAGTVLAYDNFMLPDGSQGLYALEFWPTDPVSTAYVAQAFQMLEAGMPFAQGTLAYHPSGDVQEQLLIRDADDFATHSIRTISTTELFDGIDYNPLNLGEAVGILRLMTGDDPRPPSPTDIVIYETLPNDLPLVAGVISAAPQTPLSHVNLRAQQNDIANAYLKNAAQSPLLVEHIGKPIRLTVTADRLEVTSVTTADMLAALETRRPADTQSPPRNLRPREIVALDDLAWTQSGAFGAKAANLAELRRAIDPKYVPNGFAVPFSFYHDFMVANGLYGALQTMMNDPSFQDDAQRKDLLKAFRKTIKTAPMTTPMRDKLDVMHLAFPEGTTPRCRSSANNEDLVGFTGAGLYDSYTHRLDEGHIEKSIKQVWASLWNLRAFNEREFYRIDHLTAAMGVLVHPNFDDERVNGVALTRNFYFPTFEGYFINAQVGEDMVTNPDGAQSAEEVLLLQNIDPEKWRPYETIYIRRSSLVPDDETVIAPKDLMELARQLRRIQSHFQFLYGRSTDETFAMDVEFKIDREGRLAIKQARPWAG